MYVGSLYLFVINHWNAIFLTLRHKDKEFGCTISYFKFLCHIFKFLKSSIIWMVDAKRRRLWRPRCSLCKQLAIYRRV